MFRKYFQKNLHNSFLKIIFSIVDENKTAEKYTRQLIKYMNKCFTHDNIDIFEVFYAFFSNKYIKLKSIQC